MSESKEKLVADMIRHEHVRWNQWAVGFFGAIAGVFVLWKQMELTLSLWVPCLIAVVISVLWTLAAIGIRKSTYAWWQTGRKLDEHPDQSVFKLFGVCADEFRPWRELWACISFRTAPSAKEQNSTVFSITATLVRAGLLATVSFFVLPMLGGTRQPDRVSTAKATIATRGDITMNRPDDRVVNWWEPINGLCTVSIAAFVGYIAFQQHHTNREKLKLDLHDKRFQVYMTVRGILNHQFAKGTIEQKDLNELYEMIQISFFLFPGDDAVAILRQLQSKLNEAQVQRQILDNSHSQGDRSDAANSLQELGIWFDKQSGRLHEVFAPYMKMKL